MCRLRSANCASVHQAKCRALHHRLNAHHTKNHHHRNCRLHNRQIPHPPSVLRQMAMYWSRKLPHPKSFSPASARKENQKMDSREIVRLLPQFHWLYPPKSCHLLCIANQPSHFRRNCRLPTPMNLFPPTSPLHHKQVHEPMVCPHPDCKWLLLSPRKSQHLHVCHWDSARFHKKHLVDRQNQYPNCRRTNENRSWQQNLYLQLSHCGANSNQLLLGWLPLVPACRQFPTHCKKDYKPKAHWFPPCALHDFHRKRYRHKRKNPQRDRKTMDHSSKKKCSFSRPYCEPRPQRC